MTTQQSGTLSDPLCWCEPITSFHHGTCFPAGKEGERTRMRQASSLQVMSQEARPVAAREGERSRLLLLKTSGRSHGPL